MDFTYHVKGISLSVTEMYDIKEFYEIRCTAEYIAENYKVSDKKAIKLATKVREYMNKYGVSEEDAVADIMSKWESKNGNACN